MSIKPLKSYAFRNSAGNNLTMVIGSVEGTTTPVGFRVKMIGNKIPFPVRCNTWFQSGMGVDGLCSFMYDNDYVLISITDIASGRVIIQKIPDKVYEIDVDDAVPIPLEGEEFILQAAQALSECGKKVLAIRLLRNTGTFDTAHDCIRFLNGEIAVV